MQLSLRKSGAANEQSKVYFVVCYKMTAFALLSRGCPKTLFIFRPSCGMIGLLSPVMGPHSRAALPAAAFSDRKGYL